jgi:triosephosphate isomerase
LKYFVINTKNYSEIEDGKILDLARICERISESFANRVQIILAAPAFSIQILRERFQSLPIFVQHVDSSEMGSTTGFLVPEMAKSFGAGGAILNHSEHRLPADQIRRSVDRAKVAGLEVILCARDSGEVKKYSTIGADYLAVEPPELIGSGNAISKASPELITDSRRALDSQANIVNMKPKLLCGAGIVTSSDISRAIELGAEGILVASGVVKSKDWEKTIVEFSNAMV